MDGGYSTAVDTRESHIKQGRSKQYCNGPARLARLAGAEGPSLAAGRTSARKNFDRKPHPLINYDVHVFECELAL